jgi:hypothetical protein
MLAIETVVLSALALFEVWFGPHVEEVDCHEQGLAARAAAGLEGTMRASTGWPFAVSFRQAS